MKKLILVFTLFAFVARARAEGIRFVENKKWKDILVLAKTEKKLIFLDGYATWCGPCQYMQKEVFSTHAAGSFFNAHFINVKLDMEEGEGPVLSQQFNLTAYPTLFFINADGEVVHKYVGALTADEFVALGRKALNPETQFYTLKKKIEDGTLDPKAVHDWFHTAQELKEEGVDSTLNRYLTSTRYPILEKEMLSLLEDHVSLVPDRQLRTLYANRAAIGRLTGKTEAEVEMSLLAKLRYHALEASVAGDSINFARYHHVMAGYLPRQADGELQRVKVKYYFFKKQTDQAIRALALFIESPALGITAGILSELVTGYADKIVSKGQVNEFIQKVEGYQLQTGENEQGFYKEIALWGLYKAAENREVADRLYANLLANGRVPEKMRERIKRAAEQP